jgi:VanZ family protein
MQPNPFLYRYLAWWRGIAFLWLVAVIVYSLLPPSDMPHLHISDKIEHGVSYALLMFFFASVTPRSWHGVLALVFVAMGIGIEYVQRAVGYRHFEVADMFANGVGVAIGLSLSFTPIGRLFAALDRVLARVVTRG